MPSSNTFKSQLSPQADRLSSNQLNFLVLNAPFVVLLNNYKSNFTDLSLLRSIIASNNGFSYHPNKNVKARALKGFSMVLSPDFLSGLVVFAFFNLYPDLINFIKSLESLNSLQKLSLFSILINGHISSKSILSNNFFLKSGDAVKVKVFFTFNKKIISKPVNTTQFLINKVYLILNAHIKSIN